MSEKNPAAHIIGLLGGLTKTAQLLSTDERRFPISTVQGWKERGEIPQKHWERLIVGGREIGAVITLPMFLSITEEVE